MTTTTTFQSRIATLAGDSHVINGVAIGPGDITRGLEDEQKVWEADALEAAADSLEGTAVNALHSEAEVGRVTRAGFDPDEGVIYEAELDDAKLAENIDRGDFEVSIEARHADGGTVDTPNGEAMRAENIQFDALAIVQKGAAPSASAEAGEAAALSASDISDTLDEADADESVEQSDESAADGDPDDPVSPEDGQGEVSAGGEPDGTDSEPTDSTPSMGDDNSEDLEEEVEELRARLSEKDDEIAELQTKIEQHEEEREDVARAYAEALAAGDTVLDADDYVEKFTVAELAARFEDTGEATLADTEPDVQSGGGEQSETSSLSESEQAEVAEHREVIADLAGKDGVAKHERQRRAELVAEKTGEDPETILEEA